tara:strand:+ start:294 stop:557 length:264 start_codon:yes stop_codon:yes gene_type:complete
MSKKLFIPKICAVQIIISEKKYPQQEGQYLPGPGQYFTAGPNSVLSDIKRCITAWIPLIQAYYGDEFKVQMVEYDDIPADSSFLYYE